MDQNNNVIEYDVITMLIYLLSVIAHDPVHDFGIAIARMKKIVLYINDLVQILHANGVAPPQLPLQLPLQLPQQGQAVFGGGLNLGGRKSRHGRTPMVFGSKRNKKTPIRNPIENFYTLIPENKNSKQSKKSMKSKGSMDSRVSINSKGSMNHKDSVKSKGSMNHKDSVKSKGSSHKGIHKKPLGISELPTIREEEEKEKEERVSVSVIYSDNMATLPLPTPVSERNPYINTYSLAIAYVNRHKQDDNNMMLELCIQLNRFIYSLKLCVVQHIMSTPRVSGTVDKETILNSISVIIANISMPDEISSAYLETELPQEPNTRTTKEYAIFILTSMRTLLSHMTLRTLEPVAATQFTNYKTQQRHNIWVDLFNGPLFDNIIRVIVFGKTYNNRLPDPDIPEIYTLFLKRQDQHGGESGINHTSKIMSGGAKMVLSSFRGYAEDKRDELVIMIEGWNTLQQQQPPDETAYLNFYYRVLEPHPVGETRNTDSRLVRKLHSERFGEMKQKFQRLRERDRLRGEQQPRPSRFNERLLADLTTYKEVVDDFMEQVKSDFDSLNAEEELAQNAEEAAVAARPLSHVQASAVYNFSYVIVLRFLQYARDELTRIQNILVRPLDLDPRTLLLLPHLAFFLPIAINYINGILSRGQFQIQQLPQDFPGGPIEKDKYNTLLFQLYLLGLIHQHGKTAQPGRGLPDIDAKLADYVIAKFSSEELKAAYRALGYEYFDNDESHKLYDYVEQEYQKFVVLDNGMPASIKRKTLKSSVCFNPQRQDGAGDLFGGCTKNNQYFASMKMVVSDFEGRQTFFSKHFYDIQTKKNEVKYQFTLGDGLVIANTISNIDFNKAPNNLTANNVFEKALKDLLNLFKNNPTLTPDQLWGLLSQNENFIAVIKNILDKGIGDGDQERQCFMPEAGFIYNGPSQLNAFRKIKQILTDKFIFFGAMDRPSFWRALHMAIFASVPAKLNNQGQLVVSYTTDRTASTIVHHNCIPRGILAQLRRAPPPSSRVQKKATKPSAANARANPYGGSKTHRRLYKDYTRYTRKKSRARK